MAMFDRSMDIEPEPPVSAPVEAGEAAAPAWGLMKRILFRFAFSYLSLYLLSIFVGVLSLMPHLGVAADWYYRFWSAVVPWASPNGSAACSSSSAAPRCWERW
jgi:hypothetical protein